ncbi:glycoside hydrolase family 18 protein [Halomontanus rarus]|uniref:glycoside hydrolase family 18 protein n=1 Tax=Halomontanus rarus TaxID=3034020 RepID=UPI00293BF17E|nr:glycoside hydrolase family 18 protein [Halovivax sp. KZCA124]
MPDTTVSGDDIIGAYADGNSTDLPVDKLTHVFYSFAKTDDGVISGVTDGNGDPDRIRPIVERKAENPDLKVSISVGGWGLCEDFPEMAATQENRERFAESVVEFLREYDLDGLDYDWEFPEAQHRDDYTAMVETLRSYLDEAGEEDGKHYLLTSATSTAPSHIEGIDFEAVTPHYDFFNVMTYDMLSEEETHHTNLYTSPHNSTYSVHNTIEMYADRGVPPEKMVIGSGFYSRCGVRINYEDLVPEYVENDAYTTHWDVEAQAPYLTGPEGFISYDDPRSVRRKVDYLREQNLRGIMFWHYNGDREDELTNAIYEQMVQTSSDR